MTLWAPVVYGRTPTSDTWWRAVPEGLNQHGWLATVIDSAIAAGRELKERPRFLLAQDSANRIVGVACQASDLSDTMRSVGSRELYCFVGWVASCAGQEQPIAPEFKDLERDYRAWAAPVYEQMLAEPWRAPPTAYLPPVSTQPQQAVWPAPERQPKPGPPPGTGPWAEQAWPALWAAALATSEPLTCVIGWEHKSTALYEDATHIGVADAPFRPLPPVQDGAPPAEPPSLMPKPAQPAAAEPGYHRPPPAPVVPKPAEPVSLRREPARPAKAQPTPQALPSAPAPVKRAQPEPSGEDTRRDRVPVRVQLAIAAVAGATVAGVLVGILSSGSGPAPAAAISAIKTPTTPPPTTTSPAPAAVVTGPPVVLSVVIPATSQQSAGALVQYFGHMLSPGQSTAAMAVWTSGLSATAATCTTAVAQGPVSTSVKANSALQLCVELKGTPARYGLIDVIRATDSEVIATATLWP